MRFIFGENLLKNIENLPIYWRWFFKTLYEKSCSADELDSNTIILLEFNESVTNNIANAKIIRIPLEDFTISNLPANEYILTPLTQEKWPSGVKNFIYLPPIIDDSVGISKVSEKNNYVIVFDENYLNDFVLKRLIPILRKNIIFNCFDLNYLQNPYDKILKKLSSARKILAATKNSQINHWLAALCRSSNIPFLLFYDEDNQHNRYNKEELLFYKINTNQFNESVYSYGNFTSKIRKLVHALKINTAPSLKSINVFNYQSAITTLSTLK